MTAPSGSGADAPGISGGNAPLLLNHLILTGRLHTYLANLNEQAQNRCQLIIRQIIIDGTQLYSSRKELDGKSLYRIHNRGTEREYRENYYYVLEAKPVLHPGILVSIMTEFVDNEDGDETGKQDCERKACRRLMEKLKQQFPRLPVCLSGDSLYACEGFFRECREKGWRYILRYKEGSIPGIAEEYRELKKREQNRRESVSEKGKTWYDYVTDIDYNGYRINLVEYGENREHEYKKGKKKGSRETVRKEFWYVTDLPIKGKQAEGVAMRGRMENEGFNTQKSQGYYLEHLYSRNYQALKNHYYLIQIGHMIAQVMEAWKKVWEKAGKSREQKHRRMLESMKGIRLKEIPEEAAERIQIRFS